MSGCCGSKARFDGASKGFRRALWAVIALNATMFVVEIVAGEIAGSQALKADALDFAGDTLTYGISLAVIGMSLRRRAVAALAKGVSLSLMGLWVMGSTLWRVFAAGVPEAEVMGIVGVLALAANLASVVILMSYRDGDANVRSVWLCSRNDAVGNVAVMIAALGVFGSASAWPDLLVAGVMSALFLSSSVQILRQGIAEYRAGDEHDHAVAGAHAAR
ncbi:cation transporter [Acuticoccus mangrovi]|uniref:Cation transporter n=1 Tax=Acuticoccus mangrovi TaxID=2796142 RepID=A0A934IH42_9HYPH|nr:cation transporter [Acuticoccus mangrovi]MBJ3776358.1 cation transporter [Acuticoccus mangrovi]